jgi:hypothetical protein
MSRSSTRSTLVVGLLLMVLLPALAVAGMLAGTSGARPEDTRPAAVIGAEPDGSAEIALPNIDRQPPTRSGEPLDAHWVMLEQMRVNVTPQMVQTMSIQPLAPSPVNLAELEQQAADVDRMLARNP